MGSEKWEWRVGWRVASREPCLWAGCLDELEWCWASGLAQGKLRCPKASGGRVRKRREYGGACCKSAYCCAVGGIGEAGVLHVPGCRGFRGFELAQADGDERAELKALAVLPGRNGDPWSEPGFSVFQRFMGGWVLAATLEICRWSQRSLSWDRGGCGRADRSAAD